MLWFVFSKLKVRVEKDSQKIWRIGFTSGVAPSTRCAVISFCPTLEITDSCLDTVVNQSRCSAWRCLVFRFHENTTCKKMDARLDRQAKRSIATALHMYIGHIVGHQHTFRHWSSRYSPPSIWPTVPREPSVQGPGWFFTSSTWTESNWEGCPTFPDVAYFLAFWTDKVALRSFIPRSSRKKAWTGKDNASTRNDEITTYTRELNTVVSMQPFKRWEWHV